jgi:Zn-finger nucleic acid-binding protein
MPLSGFEASPGVEVELCAHCRGLFLDRHEIRQLVGGGSLAKATEVVPVSLGDEIGMRCPKCVDPAMQPLRVRGAEAVESWQCRSCGGLWLGEGAFFALARSLQASRRPVRLVAPPEARAAPILHEGPDLAHSRSRHDRGIGNLVGAPVALAVGLLLCSTSLGRLFASLVGMPFHELGHAAASWLSSRIAIPLPFFTFWFDDQSVLMGVLVVGGLGWLMFHTYREKNYFMLSVAGAMLSAWAIATFFISPTTTLMWQILAGALGEIVFGAFLLLAFHFPLPDRFRWDFWRWVALIPGALCFVHALLLWRTVSADVSQMPWGAAIGAESDGDMNRLVQQFAWDANDLADFYLAIAYGCLAALGVTYAYAAYRLRSSREINPPKKALPASR